MPSWSSKEGVDPAPEARALGATCGGVRVWSLYVPNGRTLADPHLQYKLEWLEALRTAAARLAGRRPGGARSRWSATGTSPRRTTTSGTWPSSPTPPTSPRPSAPPSRASSTPGTPTSSGRTRPGPGVYTYWDYTQLRFPRREGMRIDFVLGSPALAGRVTGALIDREERKGKGASDHAPVIVDLTSGSLG